MAKGIYITDEHNRITDERKKMSYKNPYDFWSRVIVGLIIAGIFALIAFLKWLF